MQKKKCGRKVVGAHYFLSPLLFTFFWLFTTPFHLSSIIHSGKYCCVPSIHANNNECFCLGTRRIFFDLYPYIAVSRIYCHEMSLKRHGGA